jgi:hypothetical protein
MADSTVARGLVVEKRRRGPRHGLSHACRTHGEAGGKLALRGYTPETADTSPRRVARGHRTSKETPMKTSTSMVTIALMLTAATAHAESLGEKGQIAVSGDFELAITSDSVEDGDSTTNITLAPALDFFLARNLSVGGQVVYAQNGDDLGDVQTFGAAARVGYVIGLGKISIWPRGGLSFARSSFDTPGDDLTITRLTLNVYAPVLFHPVDHFFLGLGPVFDVDLVADDDSDVINARKVTSIGVVSTIGGYF